MLSVPCPWCGPRDEVEFRFGGQAYIAYPSDPDALTESDWSAFLFMRENPKGPAAERWYHVVGCRRWFNAIRDTVSNEFLTVDRVGDPRP
jgi:heterotetrameric sarcosine oxidase delta subunit